MTTRANLAPSATATATSTFGGYAATRVNDGNHDTTQDETISWANDGSLPAAVELTWPTAQTFGRVDVYSSSGYEMQDYDVDTWNGSAWVNVAQVRGATAVVTASTFASVTTTKLRINGLKGPAIQPQYVRINEIDVFANQAPLATVTASSTFAGYSTAKTIDGDRSLALQAGWANASGELPATVELVWPGCRAMDRVDLFTTDMYEIADYDLEAWDGTQWVLLDMVRGNTADAKVSTFSLLATDRLRIKALAGPATQAGFARVNEVEVY